MDGGFSTKVEKNQKGNKSYENSKNNLKQGDCLNNV